MASNHAEPTAEHPRSTVSLPPSSSDEVALKSTNRPVSRQSNNSEGSDDEAQFWDSQTTAAQSRPASPAAATPTATEQSFGASQNDSYRYSFYTAVDPSESNSPRDIPGVELTSPTPLPARLQSERQRWLLSRNNRSTTFPGTYPPSSSASSIASVSSPSSDTVHSSQGRSPASHSSHGVETAQGPPPALLSRTSQPKDSSRKSPTSPRTFAQKSLQPLKLLVLKGSHSRQDSATTITDKAEALNTDQTSKLARSRTEILLSPKTRPAQSLDGRRPKSAGHIMAQTTTEEFYGDNGEGYSQEIGESGTEGHSSEDIFLNLAQDSPHRYSLQERIEKRRVGFQSNLCFETQANSSSHESLVQFNDNHFQPLPHSHKLTRASATPHMALHLRSKTVNGCTVEDPRKLQLLVLVHIEMHHPLPLLEA